jgi:hypothetical protein
MERARQWAWLVLVPAVLVASAGSVGAQGPMRFGPRGDMEGADDAFRLPLLLRSARLTPDQQSKMRDVLAAHRAVIRGLTEQLRQAQDEVADKLFAAGAVQPTDLQPLLQRITQLREQLLQESAKVAVEARALLSADQVAQAARVKDRLRALTIEMRQLLREPQP